MHLRKFKLIIVGALCLGCFQYSISSFVLALGTKVIVVCLCYLLKNPIFNIFLFIEELKLGFATKFEQPAELKILTKLQDKTKQKQKFVLIYALIMTLTHK